VTAKQISVDILTLIFCDHFTHALNQRIMGTPVGSVGVLRPWPHYLDCTVPKSYSGEGVGVGVGVGVGIGIG